MNELTDFMTGLAIQVASYLKVRKNHWGWLLSMLAIIYWVVRGYTTGYVSQCFWHFVSFCVAFWGFFKWRNNDN